MKKTAPDGAVSGMPAIWETGVEKNLQAITVSTWLMQYIEFAWSCRPIRRSCRIRHEQSALCQQSDLLFESGNYRKAHAIIPNVTKLRHVPHSLHFRIWLLFLLRHWQ
ncbi:hypothetical protein DEN86_19790 [Escherichia coli]|nr:hypothetical protein AW065_22590 [Escherichia coli]OTC20725.1 hypothetical protein AW073_19765 [Escherichia coli]OTE58192.1 hypothetical protein AW118_17710 [Escherichia coli]PDV43398.1 hypothetical protein BER14_19435 [Escherichia coli]TFY46412.1 hypothetical protein DEN86_19790 [Escherichia coli]